MTILQTNQDIISYALNLADEAPNATSDFFDWALQHYNRVHRAICNGATELEPTVHETWYWLRKDPPGTIILQPAFTGQASVSFLDSAVALADPPAYSLEGWLFFLEEGQGDFFRVASHTAGDVALILDSVYTGQTNTAASAKAVKLIYDLAADTGEVIGPMRTSRDGGEVEGVEPERLERDYAFARMTQGVPEAWALMGHNKVQFSGYAGDNPEDIVRVEYDYLIKPEDLDFDTNEPLVPLEFRHVLADYTAYFILGDKHDLKAEKVGQSAQAGLMSMVRDNQSRMIKQGNDTFGQILPRRPSGRRRGLLRTTSGHIIG
jgi:hypothetical protein